MLKRLEWIKSCGIFEDYRWDSSLPELARINVVYGPNGSGKTSLAGAFDSLRNAGDGEGYKRVSVAIDDGSLRSTNGIDDVAFDRVRVFSEHYVARSHKFTPADAEMEAVLTIGEKPVQIELELEELRKKVADKTIERDTAAGKKRTSSQAADAAYGQVSQQVVDAASNAGGRWRSRSNFNAGMVRTAFGNSHADWVALSENALHEKIGLINSSKADPIPDDQLRVQAPDYIAERLSTALAASPSSIILDTLSSYPEATSWVDTGRHLHKELDACIFCGNALSGERKAQIDQHFSDEVERLQADIRGIVRDLAALEESVGTAVSSLPSKGLFFDDLKPRYADAVKALRDELKALLAWAEAARGRAEVKATNVLAMTEPTVNEAPVVLGDELIGLRAEHNKRVSMHDSLVQSAAKAVELHYLKAAEDPVKLNQDAAATEQTTVERLDGEIAGHNAEITTLDTVDGDPMPSAKVLTEEVARLLGRDELKFDAVDGKYRVTRDAEPAIGLSVGERTAITLIHFLESVARFDASKGKPIVVIDDPVSSLDSDIFMGISSYIWTEVVVKDHIAQLFLLSHNFELFRQWDIQVEGLHGGGRTSDGKKLKDVYSAAFYEIRSRHRSINGRMKRQPALVSWPPTERARKLVRSTYHHAFIVLAEARTALAEDDSLEHRLNAQLLFPNVIRRMLETFLAFKHPEWVGNFGRAMSKSAQLLRDANYVGDADALRLRLTRYSHAHSHSESPTTDVTMSPDEIATAIGAVFEFMNCLDPAHFAGLCEVVGIDPKSLLPVISTPGVPATSSD